MSGQMMRHVVARGRVQGVSYRAFVEHAALKAGIAGWVRNRRDGSVEAVFTGDAAAVEAVIAACRQGPPAARVEALDQREATPGERALRRPGDVFSVLPTA